MDMNRGDTRLIINECKARGVLRNQCAYLLATTRLETDGTMKPIKEYGGDAYFKRMYDPQGDRPKVAAQLGNTKPGDGARFAGRGHTMVTGRTNYGRLSKATGIDLIHDPDRAMDSEISVVALIDGAMNGWWTGRKLGKYVNLKKSDFHNARKVINWLDRAAEIARMARQYDEILLAEGYGVADAKAIPVPKGKPKIHKDMSFSKELVGIPGFLGLVTLVLETIGQLDTAKLAMILGAGVALYMGNRLLARFRDER